MPNLGRDAVLELKLLHHLHTEAALLKKIKSFKIKEMQTAQLFIDDIKVYIVQDLEANNTDNPDHCSMMSFLSDDELLMIAIVLDEEEKERKKQLVHPIWKSRDKEGEFSTLYKCLKDDEVKFHGHFRMSRNTFSKLFKKVEPLITRKDTFWRPAITPMERLAVCLRFLATGDSFKTISYSYRLGHSTVHKIVKETCEAIIRAMIHEVMPHPTEEMWKAKVKDFQERWNFPNCLGSVDGKHVVIQAPPNSCSQYFNYKKTFSVVLLALVDANYNFIAVDIGSYGKNSDGGVWAHSNIGKAFEQGALSVPGYTQLPGSSIEIPHVIVGDEAFPLKSYIMRPYPGQQLDRTKRIFNYRLSRARRVVENTFGILTQKFRIYNRRIQSKPESIDNIILATCVLHIFIRKYDDSVFTLINETSDSTNQEFVNPQLHNLPLRGGNSTRAAFCIRDKLKDYFCSEAGSVPWQEHI
ncbi:uncharacterized protein [Anabrus simplex]|uniref:uncharacterized protein n=1 Tax=Anabrus simplex TaxID=316456 RepID=UPI0035A2BADE